MKLAALLLAAGLNACTPLACLNGNSDPDLCPAGDPRDEYAADAGQEECPWTP